MNPKELEEACFGMGRAIEEALDEASPSKSPGYFLGVFEFGPPGSFSCYVSNANRKDAIAFLRELANRLEEGMANTKGASA